MFWCHLQEAGPAYSLSTEGQLIVLGQRTKMNHHFSISDTLASSFFKLAPIDGRVFMVSEFLYKLTSTYKGMHIQMMWMTFHWKLILCCISWVLSLTCVSAYCIDMAWIVGLKCSRCNMKIFVRGQGGTTWDFPLPNVTVVRPHCMLIPPAPTFDNERIYSHNLVIVSEK